MDDSGVRLRPHIAVLVVFLLNCAPSRDAARLLSGAILLDYSLADVASSRQDDTLLV